jgi:hypothetical protein
MTTIKVGASPRPSLAAENESHPFGVPPANDNEALVAVQRASKDNQAVPAVHAAANDNRTAATHAAADDRADIRVIDDLPRPLPVLPGEGEIVRKLIGTRFRQLLFGDKQ